MKQNFSKPLKLELFAKKGPIGRMNFLGQRPPGEDLTISLFRLYVDEAGNQAKELGFVVAPTVTGLVVGTIKVRQGDVVVFGLETCPEEESQFAVFRINRFFVAEQTSPNWTHDSVARLWAEISMKKTNRIVDAGLWHAGFEEWIRSPHTPLITECINTQIAEWKSHALEDLIYHVSGHVDETLIEQCTIQYPFLTLKRLSARLSRCQLDRCIAACPEGAVRYVLDQLTGAQLDHVAEDYPEMLLQLALDKIPEKILRKCASASPDTAFQVRVSACPKVKALLLSYTVEMAGLCFDNTTMEAYSEEVQDSLIDFHEVWKLTYENDWPSVIRELELLCGIPFNFPLKHFPPTRPAEA